MINRTGKGRKILGRKRISTGGKDLGEEKGEDLRGGKALGGKGGKDLNRERRGKILGRKGRRSGGKGLRGERSTGKGVQKI